MGQVLHGSVSASSAERFSMILSVSAIAPARLSLTTEGALAPGQVETDMVAWQGPLIAPELVAPRQKANQSFRKFGLNVAVFFHGIA